MSKKLHVVMAASSLNGESWAVKAFTFKVKADEFIQKFQKDLYNCSYIEEEQSLLEMIKISSHHHLNDLLYITLTSHEVEIED